MAKIIFHFCVQWISVIGCFGVPHGSVIGPIMFIIFMNDIVKCSDELKYSMYADDACVWSANNNLQDSFAIMNRELIKINKWMSNNCLTLNNDKCEYVFKNKCNLLPDAGVLHISIDDVTLTIGVLSPGIWDSILLNAYPGTFILIM